MPVSWAKRGDRYSKAVDYLNVCYHQLTIKFKNPTAYRTLMDVIKVKREQEYYIIRCPKCPKSITGISVKQVKHNYKVHRIFCDERRRKQIQQEELEDNNGSV